MEEYIRRALEGDHGAFMRLYDQYGERALRLAMSVTGNCQLAEDAVQEAFVRVYRNGRKFDRGKKFEPWFFRIVINESRRALSRQRDTVELDWDIPESGAFADQVNLSLSVGQALARLSPEHRAVLSLKFLMDYTEAEIAEVIERPVGTVKSRLYHAKRAMADLMREGDELD